MATLTLVPTKIRALEGSQVQYLVAAEASKVGKIVYVAGDGLAYETDAAVAATVTGTLGMIVSGGKVDPDGDIAVGETCGVLLFGMVALNGTTLDETKQYYAANVASTVKGLIGDVAGTVKRRLGSAVSETVFFFNPQSSEATS